MLPEKSQGKVLHATVVAVGPGSVNPVIISFLPLCKAFFFFLYRNCVGLYSHLAVRNHG